MVRSEDQSRFQFGIERPEEELHALRIDWLCVHRLVWWENTGERCAKEVEVVLLKTPPDADIVGEVFSAFHQERREGLALSAGEMKRVIGQGTLGFGEEPAQLLGNFRQGSFTTSKTSLGAMSTKIH